MAELQDPLPPGWDCKYDRKQGKYYFINHNTKTTTWDDPRVKRRIPLNPVEQIQMQHGSPDLRRNYVYPRDTSPIPAFQAPGHYSPKKYLPLQEMRGTRSSPLTVRGNRYQDSSLTTNSAAQETDEAVTKISSLFPTVSDTHIRLLLKKYHNREAVVISALQVEKHPITTPGPFATPPPTRNIQAPLNSPLAMRNGLKGSPVLRAHSAAGSPRVGNSPRPHSSPKLKLRYMKSIFPKAEETMILDILANNDNNIQKASDALKKMGFEKRDVVKILQLQAETKAEEKRKLQEEEEVAKIAVVPKILTVDDKKQIKLELKQAYADTPEQVICLALESVHFDKEKANQVLQIMLQEDNKSSANNSKNNDDVTDSKSEENHLTVPGVSASMSRQSLKSLLKSDNNRDTQRLSRLLDVDSNEYKVNQGPDPQMAKGANDQLLLEDYVKWQGPNPMLHRGPSKGLAKGPNLSLRINRSYTPCGANAELRKGPICGLAKGSIFSQMKRVIVGESRMQ